eukprot:symbB.v1.2.039040.t1/scaffold6310.1/size19131/1
MGKLKAELMDRQGPLFVAEKVRRMEDAEQQKRHFKELEELRAIQVSLKKQLSQVEDYRRHAACRPIQHFWRQRKRRQEAKPRGEGNITTRYGFYAGGTHVVTPRGGLAAPGVPRTPRTPGNPSASPTESVIETRASTDLAEEMVLELHQHLLAEDDVHTETYITTPSLVNPEGFEVLPTVISRGDGDDMM